jgi:hypothetical protein
VILFETDQQLAAIQQGQTFGIALELVLGSRPVLAGQAG